MKVIVTIRGFYRNTHPQTVGEFRHIPKYDAYLYDGREFTPEAFNDFSRSRDWERIIERHGARVSVLVVTKSSVGANRPTPQPGVMTLPVKPKNKGGRPRKVIQSA